MAARSRLAVQLVGVWNSFTKAVDPETFKRRLDQQLRVAHARMGRQFVRNARQAIRAGNYAPNSALTVILKGSSKPLVDTGDLAQAITYEVLDDAKMRGVRVGLIRAKGGAQVINIGAILHEGATIDIGKHPAVRRAVWAKVRDGLGAARFRSLNAAQRRSVTRAALQLGALGVRRSRPMTDRQRRAFFGRLPKEGRSSGKSIWRIPARPFLTDPLNESAFITFVRETWSDAVRTALFPPGQR